MASSGSDSSLRWWIPGPRPAPLDWSVLFGEISDGDSAKEWGIAVGLFILHYRRRHSEGPTFRALFEHLFPETHGAPSQRRGDWDTREWIQATHRFRFFAVIAWSRQGWLSFDHEVQNSLRPGRRMLALAERNDRVGALSGAAPASAPKWLCREALTTSLTSVETATRLHVSARFLRRATDAGFLLAVRMNAAEIRYPVWQFSDELNEKVVRGVKVITPSVPQAWSLVMVHRFFATTHTYLRIKGWPQTPAMWLRRGGDPIAVAIILESFSYDVD